MTETPWRGVLVAAALPFDSSGAVDLDRMQAHVAWLADSGCDGVVVNGSLGEYQTLTDDERSAVVVSALEAAPAGFAVVPGVGGYGGHQSRRWAEQARAAGAPAVMALPPNSYRADDAEVVAHFREVARAGLPIVAYNNPFDTRVDLVPELLAKVAAEVPEVVAVKEFSGDLRRIHGIAELAPRIDVLAGADDVLLELQLMGAVGWIAGFPNAFPRECMQVYRLGEQRRLEEALALYRTLHPLLRWDSRPEFVQAIKLSMDLVGRYGGPTRLPRLPLHGELDARVRADVAAVLATLEPAAR